MTTLQRIYDKCNTKGPLYDDRHDTCVTMLKTFIMSVIDVYIVRQTDLHKYNPLKPLEQAYIHFVTINM